MGLLATCDSFACVFLGADLFDLCFVIRSWQFLPLSYFQTIPLFQWMRAIDVEYKGAILLKPGSS